MFRDAAPKTDNFFLFYLEDFQITHIAYQLSHRAYFESVISDFTNVICVAEGFGAKIKVHQGKRHSPAETRISHVQTITNGKIRLLKMFIIRMRVIAEIQWLLSKLTQQ